MGSPCLWQCGEGDLSGSQELGPLVSILPPPVVRWGHLVWFPSPPLSRGPEAIFLWPLNSRAHTFVTPISITTGKIVSLALGFWAE